MLGNSSIYGPVAKKLIDRTLLDKVVDYYELAEVIDAGENLIIEVFYNEVDDEYVFDYSDDDSEWLSSLASLRADMLDGVWRLPYLIWLLGVDNGSVNDDEKEPITGLGPLTSGMAAFAELFDMDIFLVQAAAEIPANLPDGEFSSKSIHTAVESIPEEIKTEFLQRLAEGDPHVGADLRSQLRDAVSTENDISQPRPRTVSEIKARSIEIREESEAEERKRREAERLKREQQAAIDRLKRIDILRIKGESVWREIDKIVSKFTYKNYDQAAEMLYDLQALSEEENTTNDFQRRFNAFLVKHSRKQQFIFRLKKYDLLTPNKPLELESHFPQT